MYRHWIFSVIAIATCAAADPAAANLTLCNKSPYKVTAAVAYFRKDPPGVSTGGHSGGTVHGWWQLDRDQCKVVDNNVARDGWFYFYAETLPSGRNAWQGTSRLCANPHEFSEQQVFLMGNQHCDGNHEEHGFVRIDTDAVNFKQNLLIGN